MHEVSQRVTQYVYKSGKFMKCDLAQLEGQAGEALRKLVEEVRARGLKVPDQRMTEVALTGQRTGAA